jgi:hypothetical protein
MERKQGDRIGRIFAQGCQILFQISTKCTKCPSIIQNGHQIYQHFPIKGPTKFTQIVILGLKINHLATLFSPIWR